ncbi:MULTISPECIES: hypothetical protein [Roseivirga]|uniref:Uncharacterized protein n=1 Tax=Roseivirga spongicola TaxID=333140 RepID=A0A150XAW6_9BACT|nr:MULTISPECIES: hypothetical protein [Roseivirga]KYG75820.1 hypothetical protein AWW68_08290 [Roseivirga spongicola]MBO6495898.1 hypothetical protein [Roseivirga sp.]WPZ10611.1 hypothetical protein T7867_00695 [Roseivirga spongicola]
MKTKILFAGCTLFFLTCLSCTSSKSIYKHLTKEPATLSYLNESAKELDKLPIKVKLDSSSVWYEVYSLAKLDKTESKVVPAIFFNSWNYTFNYQIGSNSYRENIELFFKENVEREIQRSGVFNLTLEESDISDYELSVSLDSFGASGPLKVDGMFLYLFLVYSISENQHAGPGNGSSKISYKLYKKGTLVYENHKDLTMQTDILQSMYQTSKALRKDFNTSLVEAASESLKLNITHMVKDLNVFLKENR